MFTHVHEEPMCWTYLYTWHFYQQSAIINIILLYPTKFCSNALLLQGVFGKTWYCIPLWFSRLTKVAKLLDKHALMFRVKSASMNKNLYIKDYKVEICRVPGEGSINYQHGEDQWSMINTFANHWSWGKRMTWRGSMINTFVNCWSWGRGQIDDWHGEDQWSTLSSIVDPGGRGQSMINMERIDMRWSWGAQKYAAPLSLIPPDFQLYYLKL